MPIKNTPQVYGWITIILHWVSALTLFGLFGLGLWMSDLDYSDAWYKAAPDLHRSIGVCLVVVTGLRFLWRRLNVQPEPAPGPAWQLAAARIVHYSFYCLIGLMLVSGYLITTAKGQPLEVFNWFKVPALVTGIEHLEDVAGEVHEILAFIIIGLAGVHAAAAIKHHLIDKDSTLTKMLGRLR